MPLIGCDLSRYGEFMTAAGRADRADSAQAVIAACETNVIYAKMALIEMATEFRVMAEQSPG
jgi:hypothetical protein